MKQLLSVILAMLVLGAVVPGCDGTHRYDSRLTAADGLMHDHADSALALLEGLPLSDLSTTADTAYYRLLLTQARYKAYIPATSDSDINRALAYYNAHPADREKLTRAYIYKGTVMEELGHPDSAMFYYKIAEATASSIDYDNLGYVELQMAVLYSNHYTMGGKEIVKYEQALDCYRHTDDTLHLMVCLNNLGCHYRETRPDTAERLLLEASQLAWHINDTSSIITSEQALIVFYHQCQRYNEARQLIRRVMDLHKPQLDYRLYCAASEVYSRLGILDSARLFLDMAQQNKTGDEAEYRIYLSEALSDLALARKDTISALRYDRESQRIADSLTATDVKIRILNIDEEQDKELLKQTRLAHKKSSESYRGIIGIVFLVLLSFITLHYFHRHKYDSLIADLKEENKNQSADLNLLQQNIDNLRINDKELRKTINSHMALMRELIEQCYHTPNNALAQKIKKVVNYQDNNKGLWEKLYAYIDMEYNNIMKDTQQRYPGLNDKELMLLALSCLGYSCAQIAVIMGYANATTIGGNRQRLAKKMGLDNTNALKEYIERYKSID